MSQKARILGLKAGGRKQRENSGPLIDSPQKQGSNFSTKEWETSGCNVLQAGVGWYCAAAPPSAAESSRYRPAAAVVAQGEKKDKCGEKKVKEKGCYHVHKALENHQ